MSSSGWMRVAAGLRMVASAAATQAAEQSAVLAGRMQHHGSDLAGTARHTLSAMHRVDGMGCTPSSSSSSSSRKAQAETVSPLWKQASSHEQEEPVSEGRDASHGGPLESQGPAPAMERKDPSPASQEQRPRPETVSPQRVPADTPPPFLSADMNHIAPPPPDDSTTTSITTNTSSSTPGHERLQEGHRVPSSRVGRAAGFASLGARLAWGTAGEFASRLLGGKSSSHTTSVAATDANADRLAATLCRMRGAALKLGQMLSIQDESLLPPALTRALTQVRQGAEAMPTYQLTGQLESQLGKDWRDKFTYFEELPFAAASIGQVHRASIQDSHGVRHPVVLKVQYPGVADSIESDLRNLQMLVTMTGLAPKGLFIENVIRVGREELKVECDYTREMENQTRFQQLVADDPLLSKHRIRVPSVYSELTTTQVLTAEYVPGGTIDKVALLDQEERNRIAYNLLYLTMQELFNWRFMQTDPNWGNFLYDETTRSTYLIDFGAAREFSKSFVDGYLRIVCANANRDEETLMAKSHEMNFLTGKENEVMLEAHKMSGFTVGEPFWNEEPFDFRGSELSARLSSHSAAFFEHRLTPPPEEVYTLHRKLAGAYNLCIKLGAVIPCRDLLRQVVAKHIFEDGAEPPVI